MLNILLTNAFIFTCSCTFTFIHILISSTFTLSLWAGPDGVQHLQSMLEKDPTFETSPNWPQLVEWCSTCTARRFVRVALPLAAQTRDKEDSEVERDVKQEIQEHVEWMKLL